MGMIEVELKLVDMMKSGRSDNDYNEEIIVISDNEENIVISNTEVNLENESGIDISLMKDSSCEQKAKDIDDKNITKVVEIVNNAVWRIDTEKEVTFTTNKKIKNAVLGKGNKTNNKE